jgi:hypothetical protein
MPTQDVDHTTHIQDCSRGFGAGFPAQPGGARPSLAAARLFPPPVAVDKVYPPRSSLRTAEPLPFRSCCMMPTACPCRLRGGHGRAGGRAHWYSQPLAPHSARPPATIQTNSLITTKPLRLRPVYVRACTAASSHQLLRRRCRASPNEQ